MVTACAGIEFFHAADSLDARVVWARNPGTIGPMAAKAKLICPLEHDSGLLWGGQPTLEYRLFHLLAENPLGLHLGQIKRALSRQHAPDDVAEEVLIESKHFCQTGAYLAPHSTQLETKPSALVDASCAGEK